MKVMVNGEDKDLRVGMTIRELLEEFHINQRNCLVELNEVALPLDKLDKELSEGDHLELARFIGGG